MLILLPAGVIVAIRNFFFRDTASFHTYPSESSFRIRNFLNPFPEVEIFEYAMNRNRVDAKSLRISVYPASDVTRYRANHQPRIVNTVKNTVINAKMATSFPGSLSYSSYKIENHNTRKSKMQISRALRGMLKKYFKNLCSFNQILSLFIMFFYYHFYFLSVSTIIDSFYKFQLQNDSKTLLIIYMLKGAIVNLQIIIIIAVLPKRFLEESWVLEFIGYL